MPEQYFLSTLKTMNLLGFLANCYNSFACVIISLEISIGLEKLFGVEGLE